MKAIICIVFVMLCNIAVLCQTNEQLTVKPGDDLTKALNFIYRYPQFKYGKVYRLNGDASAGRMNYDILSQEMQFIDSKGDTLALANENDINFTSIEADTFFHNTHGYVEQAAHLSQTILVYKEIIKTSEQKIGAYGIPTSTVNIESKKSINEDQNYLLSSNAIITLSKNRQYFFSDNHFNILPANSKNVLKVFSKQKEKLMRYFDENATDFNKEADLKKLFGYIQSIS